MENTGTTINQSGTINAHFVIRMCGDTINYTIQEHLFACVTLIRSVNNSFNAPDADS